MFPEIVLLKFQSVFEFVFNIDIYIFPARLCDNYPLLRLSRGEHGRKLLHVGSRALRMALREWKCSMLLNSPRASD